MSKLSIIMEFLRFLRAEKKWWLIPIALILIFLGALIALTQGSVLAPFIYPLF
ncbi:MAG: DUF5989 family protein [Candidatus Omnitrophota bacterium]